MSQLNILLIEDDDGFAFILRRAISISSLNFTLAHATRMSDALQQLVSERFDVVLTDLSLPDANGMQSVQKLRAFDPQLPVIVLTSADSEETAAKALQIGAQDYIVKDHATPLLLERTTRHAIVRGENTRLIKELKLQTERQNQQNAILQEHVSTAHRFVDNVSHEFRTPLTVIREYASLIREGALGQVNHEQSEFLDIIRYRIDDLNTMVDDMLDSSKLEAGIMGIHRQSVEPTSILERPVCDLKLKAKVRGVELQVNADADLPNVFCDPEKIGRVVTNLVANAIKFCDENSGRVVIHLSAQRAYGEIEFSVTDNGPGIEPDELELLFNRFQQLGTSTQSSTKGFGLGLNIARELVDQNFGTICVESKVGVGTTFRFSVPVDDWGEVVRRFGERLARNKTSTSTVVVNVEAVGCTTDRLCRDIESFWRFTERQPDLVRRTGAATWTLLINCDGNEIKDILTQFAKCHEQVSRNRVHPLPALKFDVQGCFDTPEVDSLVAAATAARKSETDHRRQTFDPQHQLEHSLGPHKLHKSQNFDPTQTGIICGH